MERITFSLDSEFYLRVKALAGERGVSIATVIREMVEAGCSQRPRRFHSLGSAASEVPLTREELSEPVPPLTWRSS